MPFQKGRKKTGGRAKGVRNKKDLSYTYSNYKKGDNVIYFINCIGTDFYKIGITKNINHRISNINSSNPHKIKIINAWKSSKYKEFEQILLKSLSYYNIKGEWFVLTDKIAKEIAKIQDYNDLIKFKGRYSNTLF